MQDKPLRPLPPRPSKRFGASMASPSPLPTVEELQAESARTGRPIPELRALRALASAQGSSTPPPRLIGKPDPIPPLELSRAPVDWFLLGPPR